LKKLILGFFLSLPLSGVANSQSCNSFECQPMTARSVCDWTRSHSIDRPLLNDDDLQAVMFDSCIYFSRIECAYVGETVLTVYKKLLDEFTGDAKKAKPTLVGFSGKALSTDLNPNIFDNFSTLQAKHADVFKRIEKIQSEFPSTVASVKTNEDASAARKQLRAHIKEIQGVLFESSYYDSVFLGMLEDAGSQLLSITGASTKVLTDANCQVLKDPLSKLSENAKTFFMRIDELRKYTGLAAYKRGLLLEKFNRSMELAIYRSYANQTGKELDQILAEIGATMNLDSLLWEVTDWWANATVNGLAGRLHTRYLQYRKPLQILAGEMARAESFKRRIGGLEGLSDIVKDQAIASLEDDQKEIQRNIDFITNRGGWQGALEAQKEAANKREPQVPASNVACHSVTQEFFDLASKAKDIDSYEAAEAKYKSHVDLCVRG
jgi:hypothetical protein